MPESVKSQNNVEQAIIDVEVQAATLKLQLQLNKNMAYFKLHLPDMYDQYRQYSPSGQKIFYDTKGYINLLNIASQTPAYNEHPETFAANQVATFLKLPHRLSLGFSETKQWNENHIHLSATNQVIAHCNSKGIDLKTYNQGCPLGFVAMVGVGLGHQIVELLNNADVRNLFIYDGSRDSFYASLHTIDWPSIIAHINQKKGLIRLAVGDSVFDGLSKMRSLPSEIGMYNLSTSYLFSHTDNKDNKAFFEGYRKDFHLNAVGMGFFDDEQISLAHTVSNINAKYPLFNPTLKEEKTKTRLPPVFIVGGGPSFDQLSDMLTENKDNAIIISAGTSISSLYKIGIKPDLHVEMERGLTTHQWLTMGTDKDYLSSINLLTLNPVSPATTALFKAVYLGIKPNDLGAALLLKELGKKRYFELPMCNPTASNCALSYALHLGFKDIYLVGTDFGMKDSHHHSKFSVYNDLEKALDSQGNTQERKGKDYTYSQGRYKVAGNFGGEVETIISLDMSRRNIEIQLSLHDDINCYNPNDGAKIHGAKPTDKDSIALSALQSNKAKTVKKLLSKKFFKHDIRPLSEDIIRSDYLDLIKKIEYGFVLPEICNNMDELQEHCDRIFMNLKQLGTANQVVTTLLAGSVQVMLSMIYSFCKSAKNDQDFKDCYQFGKDGFHQLMNDIYKKIEQEPLRPDDSEILDLAK